MLGKSYPQAINSIKFRGKLKIDFGGKNRDYRSKKIYKMKIIDRKNI